MRPLVTVQAYLNGQGRTLSHPFAFLVIAATLSVLIVNLFGDSFWLEFRKTVATGAEQWLNLQQIQRFQDFWVTLFGVLPYWMLLYSLPIALLLRLFFLRRDHTLAEI